MFLIFKNASVVRIHVQFAEVVLLNELQKKDCMPEISSWDVQTILNANTQRIYKHSTLVFCQNAKYILLVYHSNGTKAKKRLPRKTQQVLLSD